MEKKIQKYGTTPGIYLPKKWIVAMGLTFGDSVTLEKKRNGILIKAVKK